VLDDSWQKTISTDLETIQSEGHDAVRKVDANMVVKKKGGKDVEVPDGWAGHILPFDLVQSKLLTADLAEIVTYESRLREISGEIADILENMDEDDKSSTGAISEDGDSFVAAELKKAVKSIGKHPETDFDRALVSAQRLFDEEREVKKNVKNLRSALDEKTRTVIEG
jgi:type I restriction enzyme M protein